MAHKTTRQLITEIVLRGVASTLPHVPAKDVEAVADPLINMIESVIAGVRPEAVINSDSYKTFTIWNEILDKVEAEIPVIAGKLIVNGSVTRAQRKEFYAAATTNSDRQGGSEKVDS